MKVFIFWLARLPEQIQYNCTLYNLGESIVEMNAGFIEADVTLKLSEFTPVALPV